MRIIVADLSANYEGRGKTELPKAIRSIIIKEDGSILIHNEKGFKPVNYMTKIDHYIEEDIDNEKHLLFINRKEKLEIILHSIIEEHNLKLEIDDPAIIREQTEDLLQLYVSQNIEKLDKNYQFISREFETGFGPVDILAYNKNTKNKVAIEIKRNATMNAIYQVLRYIDSMKKYKDQYIEPVVASIKFNDSTLRLAERKKVKCIKIPENWDKEKIINKTTLFDL